jgi:RND superfamily putative drug exporter
VLLAVIISLALVLLTFALRTPLVPLESILGYLLSVFAALGAQVAVFQWGWAKQLLGVTPGVTLSFLPVIVLTIIFGLSNDYEVFVVSRIKEQYDRSRDAADRSGAAFRTAPGSSPLRPSSWRSYSSRSWTPAIPR